VLTKLSNLISTLGESLQFVAFCAHAGVAAYLLKEFPSARWWLAGGIILFAVGKEFWYDATYERNPPQTSADNWQDFAGYVVGVGIGLLR
jgi:uncharacterized membrane protein YedE/YeeE